MQNRFGFSGAQHRVAQNRVCYSALEPACSRICTSAAAPQPNSTWNMQPNAVIGKLLQGMICPCICRAKGVPGWHQTGAHVAC